MALNSLKPRETGGRCLEHRDCRRPALLRQDRILAPFKAIVHDSASLTASSLEEISNRKIAFGALGTTSTYRNGEDGSVISIASLGHVMGALKEFSNDTHKGDVIQRLCNTRRRILATRPLSWTQ
jgi:hypothetical protein